MKILAVNAGSSSLKFQMFEMPSEKVLISGNFERIGIDGSFYTIKLNGEKIHHEVVLNTHDDAVKYLNKELLDNKIIDSLDEIKGIGHRIVQGADYFDKTVVIDDEVLKIISDLSLLAPLHNPAAVIGIKAFQKAVPNAVHTAVFDTAFHQTMDEVSYMYALPYEWYQKYTVRKYGAHGTSHKYIAERMREILGSDSLKIISCHIGNGGSITAIKDGKCVDTSMGFTPNAGIIMGSRCGDTDVSIIPYIMEQANLSPREVDTIINKQSGLLGISGVSSDARDIDEGIANGNERCILARKMYVRRIIDYIARYYVLLGGADAIVFTAGVGENSKEVRAEVIEGLSALGIYLDKDANDCRGCEKLISSKESKVKCYIIPTNEEVMIARDTYNLSL